MYKGVVIGDVHQGVTEDDRIHVELDEVFFYHIERMEQLDFIIINGDYFHNKMYLNEPSSIYAINDMDRLLAMAKERRIKVRVVYGTESHDDDQYKVFNLYLLDKNLDFKIIYTVEEEELFPGVHVLYIPEEHIYDKVDYYKEYFNKKNYYDFVFGHGVIQEVMNYIKKDTGKKSERLKVPVFSSAELEYICKGYVVFNHYHVFSNINDKVFYVGSFSRWKHGEEDPKGFFEITKDKKDYSYNFIENYKAPTYVTMTYDQSSSIFKTEETFRKELDKIDKIIETNVYDHVKLSIQIPMDFPSTKFITQYTRDRYKFNDIIKVEITNMGEKIRDDSQKEKLQEIINKYGYVFDKSVDVSVKLNQFIKERKDKDYPIEKINYYLYRELKV